MPAGLYLHAYYSFYSFNGLLNEDFAHRARKKVVFLPRLFMLDICESCLYGGLGSTPSELQFGLQQAMAEWD